MKRVTASEARRDWFRILDEVAAGEVVVIDRNGRTIRIQRAEPRGAEASVPDYGELLRVPKGAADAHLWGWEWTGHEGAALRPLPEGLQAPDDDALPDPA